MEVRVDGVPTVRWLGSAACSRLTNLAQDDMIDQLIEDIQIARPDCYNPGIQTSGGYGNVGEYQNSIDLNLPGQQPVTDRSVYDMDPAREVSAKCPKCHMWYFVVLKVSEPSSPATAIHSRPCPSSSPPSAPPMPSQSTCRASVTAQCRDRRDVVVRHLPAGCRLPTRWQTPGRRKASEGWRFVQSDRVRCY